MLASRSGAFFVFLHLCHSPNYAEIDYSLKYRSLQYADIIRSAALHFHSNCVFLLTDKDVPALVSLVRALSHRDVQVAAMSGALLVLPHGCHGRPLYVVTSDSESMRQYLTKFVGAHAAWLLFLGNQVCLHDFFADVYIPFDCEFLVAQPTEQNRIALTEVYHVSPGHPVEIQNFGNWTPSTGLIWPEQHLYQRRHNLRGVVLRVSVNNSLFVSVNVESANKPVSVGGYIGEVWLVLESLMNFTSDYYHHGEWRDVAEMIHSGAVDMSIADILMKAQDLTFVDFIVPLVNIRTYIMIRMPSRTEIMWTNFLKPFSPWLWVSVVIAMELIAICLLATLRDVRGKDDGTAPYSFLTSLFYIYGIFCQQGNNTNPRPASSRIVFFTSYFTAVVLLSSYSASLFSSLTVRRPALPFYTFQDFVNDDSYQLDVLRNSGQMDYFKLGDALMQQIYQRLIAPHEATLPQSVLEGLQRMCSTHKRAYFASLHGVSTMLANMNCSPVVVPHAYVPGSIAMSIAKHSPYRGLFKYNLQNMRRTGVLERLLQRAFPIHLPKNEMIVQSIDLTTICPILTLLGGGVLASLLILLIEISVVDRRMNRQRRNHRVLWW